MVMIDPVRCNGIDTCVSNGVCVQICAMNAIRIVNENRPVITRDKCVGCGLCVMNCPRGAITL